MPSSEFEPLFGGLYAAVLPFNKASVVERGSLGDLLRETLKHEAKVHKAAFDDAGFTKVMRAVASGDVEALFFVAAWDTCRPKVIGATVNFRSAFIENDGDDFKISPGTYSEDICLPINKMRELIEEKPLGKFFPREAGLGEIFDRKGLQTLMAGGKIAGRVGEFAPSNTKVIRIFDKACTTRGTEADSAVLKVAGATEAMRARLPMPVVTQNLVDAEGAVDNNNFVASWSSPDGRQKIIASFTKGISTFNGEPIVQMQVKSNGPLPEQGALECVLASLVQAGETEIRKRLWGIPQTQFIRKASPSILVGGSSQDVLSSLVAASGYELLTSRMERPETYAFGGPMPEMHIHVLREPEILKAMRALGAETRCLGPHPMQPGVLDFANMPQEWQNAEPVAVRSFKRVDHTPTGQITLRAA